jgi:hypothetical protein
MAARKPARRSKRRPAVVRRASKRGRQAARASSARAKKKPTKAARRLRPQSKTGRRVRPKPAAKRRSQTTKTARRATRKASSPKPPTAARPHRQSASSTRPTLDRQRRTLSDIERFEPSAARTEGDDRAAAAARSGRDELRAALARHTETSPTLTAGDLDAKWDDAYAVGDEAPGGDNPTPDQDRVDDIGKALGVTYEDNEELRAAEKVAERDRHRWELDPASSDDWPHNKE